MFTNIHLRPDVIEQLLLADKPAGAFRQVAQDANALGAIATGALSRRSWPLAGSSSKGAKTIRGTVGAACMRLWYYGPVCTESPKAGLKAI